MTENFRLEKDSIGSIKVPKDVFWGAQTQRSLENFSTGNELMPLQLIYAITLIKKAAAIANNNLGVIENHKKDLITSSCLDILKGSYDSQFPLKIWQTGSGTQTNMNVNEVIANIAALKTNSELGNYKVIHPNDDVNKSQSTNDTFPAAIHISVVLQITKALIPSIDKLNKSLDKKSDEWKKLIKIGRTHFQDAVPMTFGQELSAWSKQLKDDKKSIMSCISELYNLQIGGTAVGTGINCPRNFSEEVINIIKNETNLPFACSQNHFSLMASHDRLANVMSQLKIIACSLFKISNDIKILSSGPRSGIYELIIPKNEPGSSIMPGKVNPTQCEALSMICTQIMGFEYAVTMANCSGTLQMNEYKPLLAFNILTSIKLLSEVMDNFRIKLINGMEPNHQSIESNLKNSLMLVTALVPEIGYEKAAEIANLAFNDSLNLREANLKLGYLDVKKYDEIMNIEQMI
tara:strand:+ start:185 stop:1570 length:1386 start_codon:yes stop_codon:yes gene_type:complete